MKRLSSDTLRADFNGGTFILYDTNNKSFRELTLRDGWLLARWILESIVETLVA